MLSFVATHNILKNDDKCDDFIFFLTLRIFSACLLMDNQIITLFEFAIFARVCYISLEYWSLLQHVGSRRTIWFYIASKTDPDISREAPSLL